jgi:hypothetical protein
MNCILVVVDKFSKYNHFLALAHPFTAIKVARLFLDQVFCSEELHTHFFCFGTEFLRCTDIYFILELNFFVLELNF